MASVTLRDVRKSFDEHDVLHGIDLHVEDGEFCVFVGPSGCGKSTLLRLICGLDDITLGQLAIESELVNDVPPAKRGVAMVFQSYALYPHMTVAQNMGYALRLARYDKADIRRRVGSAAEVLHLTDYLDRKPRQLSGGQRQRVAIGRAIVREPRVFLFDEPLSNLDAALRVEMRLEIARLKARLGTTMIYVTHDQVEAMTLADKIVVMNAGRIEQVGTPLDLYNAPQSRFVAGFIGSPRMNFLPIAETEQVAGGLRIRLNGAGALDLPYRVDGDPVELGVRPEHIGFAPAGTAGTLPGQVGLSEHLGSDTFAYVDLEGHQSPVLVRVSGEMTIDRGDRVGLRLPPENAYLIAGDGAVILSPGARAARKAA